MLASEAKKSVLIVGAGPVGLTAAAWLTKLGVTLDIVDKKSGPVSDSRALGVHARTLEFMSAFGLHEEMIRQGNITRFMTFHRFNKALFKLDFNKIKHLTRFPYMLVLPQSRTERILVNHLSVQRVPVQWQVECVGLEETEHGVTVQLTSEGKLKERAYAYVIAADGASSPIRNQLGIPFEGETYDARFLLSEAGIADNAIARNSSHVFMGETTTVAVIPQPDDVYRIVGPDFAKAAEGENLTGGQGMEFSEFDSFLRNQGLLQHVDIQDASRLVNYRIHKRIAKSFQSQRVFLAGDAAHIHSPAGGQGMNTGIHDVMNLGWKLAAVLHGHGKPSLLASYHSERFSAVKTVIDGADQAMMKVVNRSWLWRLFLDNVAPVVSRFVQPKKLLATIAQLTWNYEAQGIDHQAQSYSPGSRFPDLSLTNGKSVHQVLGLTSRPLFFVSGADLKPSTQEHKLVAHGRKYVGQVHPTTFRLVNPLEDEQGKPFVGVVAVRPDGYVLANVPWAKAGVATPLAQDLVLNPA